jgi:diaminopimelate epimerase
MDDFNQAKERPSMKVLKFTKMSGNGNDFIVIDNYNGRVRLSARQIQALCTGHLSIGADGLLLLEKGKKPYDFFMCFYNNDGRQAEMCGNGGRCIARFAYLHGHAGAKMKFMARDGPHEAEIKKNGIVKLKMIEPFGYRQVVKVKVNGRTATGSFINTGVPHFIVPVSNIDKIDVAGLGRALRFHRAFGPKGTNANFVQKKGNAFRIRTYERGVEAETYACGTGATAAAVALSLNGKAKPPVKLQAKGGPLKVYFKETEHCGIMDVWLEGGARVVCEGLINKEAYNFGV